MSDLEIFFNGGELKNLKHSDVINELHNNLDWKNKDLSTFKVIHEGAKNQKRALTFNNSNLIISNNTGLTLTDLTVVNEKTNKKYYLSLKMSESYYTLSASIVKYFLDKNTQSSINEFFGFDGSKMFGFGPEFACVTKSPNYTTVKKNLVSVLSQAIGKDVIIVHKKKNNDVIVKEIGQYSDVTITGTLTQGNYVYPEIGKRKYANISFSANIGSHTYKVDFQFRGTTATDVGPKYLRILLKRV